MAEDLDKLQPSELIRRALAGMSEGAVTSAQAALPNLGLLALSPTIRKMHFAKNQLPGFETQTTEQLVDLAQRMSEAGGRDPFKGKPLRVRLIDDPRKASTMFEHPWQVKGRKPIDRLMLAKGMAPEIMAHEVGHAVAKSPLEKALRFVSQYARKPAAQALPGLLALTGVAGPADQEKPHMLAQAAPYVGAAQLASIVGEEARANVRGANILQKLRLKMPITKRLKMFVPTSSYLGKAGLLVGAPIGILKGIEAFNRSRASEQPTMTARELLAAPPSYLEKLPSVEQLRSRLQQ